MNHLRFAALAVFLLCAFGNAQTSRPVDKKKIDPETLQRRSTAMSLLEALAIEARSYRDEPLGGRVQARVADAIWDQDEENARNLFRRAWAIAEIVDEEATKNAGSSVSGKRPFGQPGRARTNLRREILQMAARRDAAFGAEFLKKLTSTGDSSSSKPREVSEIEMAERLRLANDFLRADNVERALQFADPALGRVTTGSIQFLVALREKNAAAADQRFASLLSLANADPAADANTVSLLTSYAFTPSMYLAVSPSGIPSSVSSEPRPAPDLAPSLRRNFFQVSANILLRPFAQVDQSSAGRAGTYFIALRLLPLFQQFAPDLAASISAQLASLGPEAGRAAADAGERLVNRGMSGDGRADNSEDVLKDRLERAKSTDERDRAYAFAAMRAADESDSRARELVDKIEDVDTREGVRTFVDYNYISSLIRKKRADEALVLTRKVNLPHTLRAHFLTQIAALMGTTDRDRARELLDESLTAARRIEAGTAERAYCLIALVMEFSRLDQNRAWELLSEVVKAANAAANFTGEDGHTSVTLEGKFSIRLSTELATPTTLSELFTNLAETDFYQAIAVSKSFQGDAPRALVTIAIARAPFVEKRSPSKSR